MSDPKNRKSDGRISNALTIRWAIAATVIVAMILFCTTVDVSTWTALRTVYREYGTSSVLMDLPYRSRRSGDTVTVVGGGAILGWIGSDCGTSEIKILRRSNAVVHVIRYK